MRSIITCIRGRAFPNALSATLISVVLATTSHASTPLGEPSYMSSNATIQSRGFGYPSLSDVSVSSRWSRPRDSSDPYDTFGDLPYFFPTRIDWVYDQNNRGNIITESKASGWKFSGTINGSLPDAVGGSERLLGRDKDYLGNYTTVSFLPSAPKIGDIWSEDYYGIAVAHLAGMLTYDADSVQVDDPGVNYTEALGSSIGGYGDESDAHFTSWLEDNSSSAERTSWGLPNPLPSDFSYRAWVASLPNGEQDVPNALNSKFEEHLKEGLHRYYSRLRAAARENNGGVSIPFSCNNTSNVVWTAAYSWADYGIAETRQSNIDAKLIRQWLRDGEAIGKGQMFSPPRYDDANPPSGYVDFIRKCIASTYALGGVMMVPWDVWQNNGGGDRYFGTPAEYADLFGFIRAVPGYFAGYEEAFTRGHGIPISQFGFSATPMWLNGNSTDVLASIRARPGDSSKPVMIHLVDWAENPQSFDMIIDPNQFLNGVDIKFHLFTPTSYDAAVHQTAVDSGDHKPLRQYQHLSATVRTDGRLKVTVPALSPWGIVRVMEK